MSLEGAAIRPLMIYETKRRITVRCPCGSAPLYCVKWIETYVKPKRWHQATGRSDPRYLTTRNHCLRCAAKFATDNKLELPPAPRQDPAVGEQWREVPEPHQVVTITAIDGDLGDLTVHYDPPASDGFRDVYNQAMSRFADRYEPVEKE